MPKSTRSEEILRLVNTRGSISIQELSELIYASPSTVRRELEQLEKQGLLRRHHGGAESVLSLRPPRIIRHGHNQAEKKAIAERAAALVSPHSVIFLDASSTVQYMIPHLSAIHDLCVYTNGADTAMRLAEAGVRAISTGGELLPESMAYVGDVAVTALRHVYFDAAFLSSAGFDEEMVSDWSESESVLRRAVIATAAKKYLLADRSKEGGRYAHIVCRLCELDGVISE